LIYFSIINEILEKNFYFNFTFVIILNIV